MREEDRNFSKALNSENFSPKIFNHYLNKGINLKMFEKEIENLGLENKKVYINFFENKYVLSLLIL